MSLITEPKNRIRTVTRQNAVGSSAFDHGDGSQFDGLLADPGIVTCVHHVCHVFVRFWSLKERETSGSAGVWFWWVGVWAVTGRPHLLHHQFRRRHSDGDAHVGQFVQNVLEVQVPAGLGPGQSPTLKHTSPTRSRT